jgi:hypothetical protein
VSPVHVGLNLLPEVSAQTFQRGRRPRGGSQQHGDGRANEHCLPALIHPYRVKLQGIEPVQQDIAQ